MIAYEDISNMTREEMADEAIGLHRHLSSLKGDDVDRLYQLMDEAELTECGGCGVLIDNNLPHCLRCDEYKVRGLLRSDFL
jgi:hypothetical protein